MWWMLTRRGAVWRRRREQTSRDKGFGLGKTMEALVETKSEAVAIIAALPYLCHATATKAENEHLEKYKWLICRTGVDINRTARGPAACWTYPRPQQLTHRREHELRQNREVWFGGKATSPRNAQLPWLGQGSNKTLHTPSSHNVAHVDGVGVLDCLSSSGSGEQLRDAYQDE